ncbi:copper resistance system multicopper oxidase [Parahaliea sp. F7430]|uniref:Copper resistance system multicopper oxidase n=1 Tax=Sediminihaliea albiluteola TaxID=2758564 RepID=A0A7W2TU99_9GAMM|nr:copper resistance system multicopper oxidase [Sediminihaliea albiluteola]MBA6412080.1 copper resistance system multicopper oxidase [Sediminihaliea albiluteola]
MKNRLYGQQPLTRSSMSRRRFVTGLAATGACLGLGAGSALSMASPNSRQGPVTLRGNQFDLNVAYQAVNFTGKSRVATAINASVPAPILRWREGERVRLRVKNNLAEDTSIHWHGIILPSGMDGVPGLSFEGIKPGESFEYQFDVNQSGTYWYHSHSGYQEPRGMYGAIVIDPKEPEPFSYDRDYVVMLSDWSDEDPQDIYAKLKKFSHYYNFSQRTAGDLWRDIKEKGVAQTWRERAMWNHMRMSETDISDVTGYTYTYLMNGATPDEGWVGLFKRGEKIRLRFINAASMTIFDVRIPGLTMTVVAADGQNIEPVSVDEFRLGVAETYDVIVQPSDDSAYTVFAQSIDRSGFTRGTLTPDQSLQAVVPAMDAAPILGHRDMGMDHGMHDMEAQAEHGAQADHNQHDMSHRPGAEHHHQQPMTGLMTVDHSAHSDHAEPLAKAGFGSNRDIRHLASEHGPHVDMLAESPQDGIADPGIGLRQHAELHGRKVLTYADIRNLYTTADPREPSREIELHLTGNMSRYMWSMNGIRYSDAEPLELQYGERVRITLVNDTMMTHPMHLHGMWSELETGDPLHIPRKHTVIVQPGSKVSYLVTADAIGRWAYHCHLIYHMAGMFREVRVR